MTLTVLLFTALFGVALALGWLIDGVKRDKVSYQETRDSFIIRYNERRITVSGRKDTRLCTYRWKATNETIIFPLIHEGDRLELVEHFISRYRTSHLTSCLFRFGGIRDANHLLMIDPANGQILSEIQMKLKSFIRNA